MKDRKILYDRYKVISDLCSGSSLYQLYKVTDLDGYKFLAKVWPSTDSNLEYFRALWNSELRKLYRISSSPGVDAGLLTIRDAGFDKTNKSFILVMDSTSEGYERLSEYITKRSSVEWLKRENLIKRERRIVIWRAFLNIAEGIRKLHLQGIIHRNITFESIFFNHQLEPDSMRLGGFEWSIRLGEQAIDNLESNRSSVNINKKYGFRQDWVNFGSLLLEIFSLSDTEKDTAYLLPAEKDVLSILESSDDINTFSLLRCIEKVVNILRRINTGNISYLDLYINPRNSNFVSKMKDVGFCLDTQDEEFSPINSKHVSALKRYIQRDLDSGQILIASGASEGIYILIGKLHNYVIKSDDSNQQATWDSAYLLNPTEFRGSDGDDTLSLENARVRVMVPSDRNTLGMQPSVNWKDYLPIFSPSYRGRKELRKFQDFLRSMNQLELFFRKYEIFGVSVKSHTKKAGIERIVLEEIPPKSRRAVGQIRIPDMCQHLQREWSSLRPGCEKLILSETNSFKVVDFDEKTWEIEKIESESKMIFLKRQSDYESQLNIGKEMYIRTFGHWGQMQLINRRKRAIQKLDNCSYLLKALSQTGQVYIDTKIEPKLDESTLKGVDESKIAVINDVMRTRPIYALQGPPGTGKTTLVAHLVRELIEEDPMVQILVTAQAHGAVDVLRQKINKDAFKDSIERSKPISIRIGNKRIEGDKDEDHVESVAKQILDAAASTVEVKKCDSILMGKWYQLLAERNDINSRFIQDFQELVKRSAIITYSTATSGDLATLAEGSDEFDWTFDWSIIEEAGKAHGFDLALPLQTGHRWLLLGDHKQLPPHLFNDFKNMIQSLDEVNDSLTSLSRTNDSQDYIDRDWLREWSNWDEIKRNEFKEYSKTRLNLFKYIFESLKDTVFGTEQLTRLKSIGALAGILTTQYRMHPVIGEMISTVFYGNQIKNGTKDESGYPKAEFKSKLGFKGNEMLNIAMKESPIIWINMPDAKYYKETEDSGNESTEAPFVNVSEVNALCKFLSGLSIENDEEEVSMAILAPYNSQTRMIRAELRNLDIPNFLKPVRNVYARDIRETKWVHTVDSFQGNEADMVVVSLVRNNKNKDIRQALGFLTEESRMNVLLSRGRKKLILIGSFNFFKRQIEHLRDEDDLEPILFIKKLLDYIELGIEKKDTAIINISEN